MNQSVIISIIAVLMITLGIWTALTVKASSSDISRKLMYTGYAVGVVFFGIGILILLYS